MPDSNPSGLMPQSLTVRNRCHASKIDPVFDPVIAAAISAYREIWGDRLVEVRLLGSIGRGEAVAGVSDIDFSGVLADEPSAAELKHLEAAATELAREYPVASRVELDVDNANRIVPFRRFVLSSDSLSVYGADGFTAETQTIPRDDLIRMVTPNAGELIAMYRVGIGSLDAGSDRTALAFWSRLIGKDFLKCLRAEALRHGGEYERGIAAIHRQIVNLLPALRDLANTLFDLYRRPAATPEELKLALDRVKVLFSSPATVRRDNPPGDQEPRSR